MNRITFENRRQILQGIQSLMRTLKNEGGIFLQDFGKSTTDYKVSDIKRWYSSYMNKSSHKINVLKLLIRIPVPKELTTLNIPCVKLPKHGRQFKHTAHLYSLSCCKKVSHIILARHLLIRLPSIKYTKTFLSVATHHISTRVTGRCIYKSPDPLSNIIWHSAPTSSYHKCNYGDSRIRYFV